MDLKDASTVGEASPSDQGNSSDRLSHYTPPAFSSLLTLRCKKPTLCVFTFPGGEMCSGNDQNKVLWKKDVSVSVRQMLPSWTLLFLLFIPPGLLLSSLPF